MQLILSGQHVEHITVISPQFTKTTSGYTTHLSDCLSAIAAFPRPESSSCLKATNLLSSSQAHCWMVPLSSFTTEIQTELLVHSKDYTKQMLHLYFHKNISSCSFVWLYGECQTWSQGPIQAWRLQSLSGHCLSRGQRQLQAQCTCVGWAPAVRQDGCKPCHLGCMHLRQQLLLSCFYHCFCWTVRISKQASKFVLRQEYYFRQKMEVKCGMWKHARGLSPTPLSYT